MQDVRKHLEIGKLAIILECSDELEREKMAAWTVIGGFNFTHPWYNPITLISFPL